jgi:hypothetical protein
VSYRAQDARRDLLDDVADAIEALGRAIGALGEAYDELDEATAEQMEGELFRPIQHAYGVARRTHAAFAARHRIPVREFPAPATGAHSGDPRVHLERAVDAVEEADEGIAELQDSLMPVEVGDPELRAGLAETRRLVGDVPSRGRALIRMRGR